MPLRILTGEGPKELLELNSNVIKPENIVLIGMRDLDKGEDNLSKIIILKHLLCQILINWG